MRPAVACVIGFRKLFSMSQDQPFIWKSSLGGPVSWVMGSLWGSPRLVKQCYSHLGSQIRHHLADSVGGGFRKETMASAHLDARHFSFFLYTTGAFQAATSVLDLRGSEYE